MADILHEEIFASSNFRVQSCPRVGGHSGPPLSKVGGGGQLPPYPPYPTPLQCDVMHDIFCHENNKCTLFSLQMVW